MKKILVNLKDWFNLEENIKFSKEITDLKIILFPGMLYLYIYENSNVALGAQDVSSFESGAHTGSISIDHLKEFGVSHVLLNHNELRIEDDDILYDKVKQTTEKNVDVIICINDTDEREINRLDKIFKNIADTTRISIAYEPESELPLQEIKKRLKTIRTRLQTYTYGNLIYGGSVSKDNVQSYNKELDVEGYLISRHALDIDELKVIVELAK